MRSNLFIIIFISLINISCKKDFYQKENTNIQNGNLLTIDKAKESTLKTLGISKLNLQKKSSIAPVSSDDINTISNQIEDSLYNKFYWDYAFIEENIDGYPAILVPIKLTHPLHYALIDSMNNNGYRVAVFQHNLQKDEVLISFRDYHPDNNLIMQRMNEYNIQDYPTDFLSFHYLLGDEVTGHITFLDKELNPVRIAKVQHNKIKQYVNVPFFEAESNNLLIEESSPFSIPVVVCQQTQIAYPDFEISYIKTTIRFTDDAPLGTTGNFKTGLWAYGYDIGMKTVYSVQYNTVWKTQTISMSGGSDCSSEGQGGLGSGVYYGSGNGTYVSDNDICRILANLLNKFNLIKETNTKINNHKNEEGKSIEAGYTLYTDDLKNLSFKQSTLRTGNQIEVDLETSFNPNYGYHIIFNHYHPNDLPHSFTDILFPIPAYNGISNAPISAIDKSFYREYYTQNYMSFVETQNGDYYIYSIKDINKLNQLAQQKSVADWMLYEKQTRDLLLKENKGLKDYKAAESILLNTFGDAINLYKAIKQEDGSFKMNRLTAILTPSNPLEKLAHYFVMNCN